MSASAGEAKRTPRLTCANTPTAAQERIATGRRCACPTLIVADSYRHSLVAFDIGADGELSNRCVWA
jgi:hypothetical protein